MKTNMINQKFVGRDGNEIEIWAFYVNDHLYGLSYTTQLRVEHMEFPL